MLLKVLFPPLQIPEKPFTEQSDQNKTSPTDPYALTEKEGDSMRVRGLMAEPTGFEPAPSGLTGRRSDRAELRLQPSYYYIPPQQDFKEHLSRLLLQIAYREAPCALEKLREPVLVVFFVNLYPVQQTDQLRIRNSFHALQIVFAGALLVEDVLL